MTPLPATSNRAALREMIGLAAPTVATMASYTLMQFVDALMVTHIKPADTVYLAAQGNGAVWSFVPLSIFAGLSGVVNTYVAQHLGAGHPQRGPAYAWNALWMGAILYVTLLVPLAFAMPAIFRLMGHAPLLVDLESGYTRTLLLGGYLTMITRALSQFFYGLHRPMVTLAGAIAGNVVNIAASYALIFGELGMPRLGVQGAAVGTLLGTAVEALIPLSVFLSAKYQRLYGTRSSWRWSGAHVRDILRIGWPPALMYGNEIVCWAVFMTYLAGQFGKVHNTAGWIALRYMHLSFMPVVGISFALTAVVGRCLGARRPDLAAQRARLGIAVATLYMGLCALLFIALREPAVRLFVDAQTPPDEAAALVRIGAQIMVVAAIFQVFDGLGIALIGILRGAGDTVWPSLATIVLSWMFLIGGGAALAFGVPRWGSVGPWVGAAVYIIALGLALAWRFRGGAWKRKRLVQGPDDVLEAQAQNAAVQGREPAPVPAMPEV